MKKHSTHRATEFYDQLGPDVASKMPFALQWTFGLVRSRAFLAETNKMAYVPFLDMANHSFKPNANFSYDSENDCFRLKTLRSIENGSEVFISYGQDYNNDRLVAQYGFFSRDNANPCSIADLEVKEECFLSEERGKEIFAELFDLAKGYANECENGYAYSLEECKSVCASIVNIFSNFEALDNDAVKILKKEIEEHCEREFTTSVSQDANFLNEIEKFSSEGNGIDERLIFAIHYRRQRKALHELAVGVLEGLEL